jgi:nucleotide-binding universal stress UspA family protein
MVHRVLIAVDGSQGALRAVEYAGQIFAADPDVRLLLFHILPVTSHLLLDKEELQSIEARKIERPDLAGLYWSPRDEERIRSFFDQATEALIKTGMQREQIKSKFKVIAGDIAEGIREEAKLGNHRTLILGRRGLSRIKEFFMGSVSTKVVREARGMAVWVVD